MPEQLVATEAPTRWVHVETGETCLAEKGFATQVPSYGRCYDHHQAIKKVIDPGALMEAVQAAQDAAYGDSNDGEIDLLRGALSEALGLLGLTLPAPREPEDEE